MRLLKAIGWLLIIGFSFNLFYSLTYTLLPAEYWTDRIPPVVFSLVMLYAGYKLIKLKRKVAK